MEKLLLTERDDIFVIKGLFDEAFCREQIQRCEETIPQQEPCMVHRRMRSNTRVILDDLALANLIWDRVRTADIPSRGRWTPIGINERFRYYRYDPGMVLVFTHNVLHRGAPVETGRKYVLRSDVMFAKPKGPSYG